MEVYHLDRIARDVRTALDQNMMSAALEEIGDVDTLALNDIIRSKTVEAVKRVHSEAPPYLLDGGYNFGDEIYWNRDGRTGCGWILLPENFMRFVVFQMDDWERPVFFPISVDDPEYDMQSSRFAGIRGTSQKPVCAVSIRPEGRVLEFYSSKSEEARISRAVYIPYPRIDKLGRIEICRRCYNAVVYTLAALVASAFGDTDKSAVFNELSKSALI